MADPSPFDQTKSRRLRASAIAAASRTLGGELDDHPPYESLAGVVDGSADDVTREIIDSHLEVCPTCAAELNDLRAFAGRTVPRFRAAWLAAAAAAVVIVVAAYTVTRPTAKPAPAAVPRTATSSPIPEAWQRLVSDAVRSGRVEIPADIRALTVADAFRGANAGTAARVSVYPTGVVVDDPRPQFRWSGVAADDFDVVVYRNGQEVARSGRQTPAAWTCPQPLERGGTYRWQVTAHRGGRASILPSPPSPPAIFRILGAAEHDELARAEELRPHDDLLLGVLYARAGMLDRARARLDHYAAAAGTPAARALASSIDLR